MINIYIYLIIRIIINLTMNCPYRRTNTKSTHAMNRIDRKTNPFFYTCNELYSQEDYSDEDDEEEQGKERIATGEQPETGEGEITSVTDKMAGISEEKIEAVVTRVVQDTLERVARETMITVSEKLITEAIDTLKQSLESTPKE